MRTQDIETAVQRLEQTFPDGVSAKFLVLLTELEKWNRRVNLTAIREPREMISAHILDSNNKKIMFVQHVAGLLGLGNVVAVKGRSEDYAPGQRFDTVIARALAALPRLVEIAGHHVREDGVFVALKGRYPADELEQLRNTPWGHVVTELKVPGLEQGSRHAVLLRRD